MRLRGDTTTQQRRRQARPEGQRQPLASRSPAPPRRQSAVLAILSLLTLVCGLLTSATARADTPDPVNWPKPRFITYNICGSASQCPVKPNNDPAAKAAWADSIVHAMDYWDADVVMLQEVCYGQYAELRDKLANRSTAPYGAVWGATLPGPKGCSQWGSDYRFGLAMLVKGGQTAISNRTMTLLAPDGLEQRGLLCVDASLSGGTVHACDTHLQPTDEVSQAQQVADLVSPYANAGPTVLAGDFNVTPTSHALDILYDSNGGSGVFREVDETDQDQFSAACAGQVQCRSGEATEGQCGDPSTPSLKIDYIFVSDRFFDSVHGDAADCSTPPLSDHHLLRGAVALS